MRKSLYTDAELIGILRESCKTRTMTAVARDMNVSVSYISDIVSGKRNFPEWLGRKLGFDLVFVPVKPPKRWKPVLRTVSGEGK